MKTSRETAVDILCKVDDGKKSHEIMNEALLKSSFSPSDSKLVKLLVNGTLENLPFIDQVIAFYSGKNVSKHRPVIRNVLRISIYQLKFLPDIGAFAVCSEALKIVEKRKLFGLKGFVNGLLRKYARDIEEGKDYSLQTAKEDIFSSIMKQRGADPEDFARPGASCRFVFSRGSEEEIISLLESDGVLARRSLLADNAYFLEGYTNLFGLKAFSRGLIQFQGVGSCLACEILSPSKGSLILDMCAAPGGKTIALADMAGKGTVVSRDISDRKLEKIAENAKRCGLENIIIQKKDATVFYAEDDEKYDFIMADLPCSGLGSVYKRPEIRYRVTKEKISELSALQKSMLKNAVKYLKKGGLMVYSTCTISYEENEENGRYLESLGMTPVDFSSKLSGRPFSQGNLESSKFGHIQLLPGLDGETDGFYISLYKKPE